MHLQDFNYVFYKLEKNFIFRFKKKKIKFINSFLTNNQFKKTKC